MAKQCHKNLIITVFMHVVSTCQVQQICLHQLFQQAVVSKHMPTSVATSQRLNKWNVACPVPEESLTTPSTLYPVTLKVILSTFAFGVVLHYL